MTLFFAVGERIGGRYQVLEPLQAGTMGAVYRAVDRRGGREVAVKVLHDHWRDRAEFLARFEREARALQALRHPHIVEYLGHGHDEAGRRYLVTELLAGTSGLGLVERVPALSAEEVIGIIGQLCSALTIAHSRGIIHRDLKWSNVMISPTPGEPLNAKLIDFGILKYADEGSHQRLTRTDVLLGTPEYVSPEQVRGDRLDGRSDLYALAVMTWELLVGCRPFVARNRPDLLLMHVQQPPPPLAGRSRVPVPAGVEVAVLRGLAKAPEDRYATVAQYRSALVDGLAGRP